MVERTADYATKAELAETAKRLEAKAKAVGKAQLPLSGGIVDGELRVEKRLTAAEMLAGKLSSDFSEVANFAGAEIYRVQLEPLEKNAAVYELVEKTNQAIEDFGLANSTGMLPNRPQSATAVKQLAAALAKLAKKAQLEKLSEYLEADETTLEQLAAAFNQIAACLKLQVKSESLQQSLESLGKAIENVARRTQSARLLALDVDQKLARLDKTKQDAGSYLNETQLAKRFLESSGGTVTGKVAFSGAATAVELSAGSLSVDFAKLLNAAASRSLSSYVLHVQGSSLVEIQTKCNDIIAYAELPLVKLTASDIASSDYGRSATAELVEKISKLAGVEGPGADPSVEAMRLALNRALRKLNIFGSGLSLQAILQNYQTRNLLIEAAVGQCFEYAAASEAAAAARASKLEEENEKLKAEVAELREDARAAMAEAGQMVASVQDGLRQNIELTPSNAQFARLSAEVASLRGLVAEALSF